MVEKIETWFKPIHEFIISNSNSVIFWVTIIFIGLAMYGLAYTYFSKD